MLGESATAVVAPLREAGRAGLSLEQATALLIGPVFFPILSGRAPEEIDTKQQVDQFLRVLAVD
ncbi:hypothetical protein [Streptomyces albus]